MFAEKAMEVKFAHSVSSDCDALVLCVADKQDIAPICGFLSCEQVTDYIKGLAESCGFNGEFEKTLPIIVCRDGKERRIILVGLGNKDTLNSMQANRIGIVIFEQMQRFRIKRAAVAIDVEGVLGKVGSVQYIESMACGLATADFSMAKHYKVAVDPTLPEPSASVPPFAVESAIVVAKKCCVEDANDVYVEKAATAVKFTKELCALPANYKTPEILAKKIKDELCSLGVQVEVMNEKEIAKLGMHALLGVGQGSNNESRFVAMRWGGGKKDARELAFVGKGVVFDTGGISIKPAKNMDDMKFDMSGAAAVVGVMHLLASREAKVNAVGVIGLVENMPSGNAIKPGDVLQTMSGKSIEVLNTDAEGRLLLADLLWYAQTKCNPLHIVDLATLTGAITVALGNNLYGGLFSNDDELAELLLRCGTVTGERLWRLPMDPEFDKMISSDIADVKNISSVPGAGSITAAHFLKRFVKEGTSWAHLDIAGMAYRSTGLPTAHCRAVGFGVYLLNRFASLFE